MKLLELIVKLQEIEHTHPGKSVSFQKASDFGNVCATEPLILLDVSAENGQGYCLLTFGMLEEDIKKYQDYLKIRAQQMRRH